MAPDPVTPMVYCIAFGVFVAIVQGTAAVVAVFEIPACDSWGALLGGCNSTISKVLSYGILGTIPGAAPEINWVMGIIGLSNRAVVVWSIVRLARGGG